MANTIIMIIPRLSTRIDLEKEKKEGVGPGWKIYQKNLVNGQLGTKDLGMV